MPSVNWNDLFGGGLKIDQLTSPYSPQTSTSTLYGPSTPQGQQAGGYGLQSPSGTLSNYNPFPSGNVSGASTGPKYYSGDTFIPSASQGSTREEISAWEQSQRGMAGDQAKIELEQAMSEYDRQAELGQQQIGSLEQEQTGTLSDIGIMRERATKEGTTAKTEAESVTLKEKGKALSTAQDTQRTNRNILRALGILSSSAAGEMLTKPMTEFGRVAGELGTQLVKRKSQVDDWLMQRTQDFDSETRKVQQQYSGLINNIRTDLRYNGEQRALAVRAASSALQQRLAGIQQQAMQYQQAAREYNNNILAQIAQIQLYQNPQADVSSILSAMLNPGQQTTPNQPGMQLSEEQRRKQQGLLSNNPLGYRVG